MNIRVYSPEEQAVGEFDGGLIKEQKPIGFPGEGSAVKRVGPLFYWAWFKAEQGGVIPLHPHRGFEILTYVLQGKVNHRDTLGRESQVGPGGAQIMQTGRGASHSEEFGPDVSGFQIWFEPFFGDALKRVPVYAQYEHEAFPAESHAGAAVKTIIGSDSPIRLVADVSMWDVTLEVGKSTTLDLPGSYSIAGLVVQGRSTLWTLAEEAADVPFRHFAVSDAAEDGRLHIQADADEPSRVILIQVPTELGYLPYDRIKLI